MRRWWVADGEPTAGRGSTAKYAERIDGMTPDPDVGASRSTAGRSGSSRTTGSATTPTTPCSGPDPDAIGVDYAIGEPTCGAAAGSGARMLWAWMLRARHRFPDATTYFAAPDHRNVASLRILAKAGFTEGLWFDEPQEDGAIDTVVGCTLDVAPAVMG